MQQLSMISCGISTMAVVCMCSLEKASDITTGNASRAPLLQPPPPGPPQTTPPPMLGAGCSPWVQTSTPINLCLLQVTQASKVWGEVPLPEDLETDSHVKASQALLDDDEDFAADEASGGGRNVGGTASDHSNSCP